MTALMKEKDFGGISRVYLLLGPACNMACRHCTQTPVKSAPYRYGDVANSVWGLLDNYVSYVIRGTESRRILFWGGEPLLHWDLLRDVVVRYTERYNLLSLPGVPGLVFGLTTNGLLLDDEKVDFFNRYRVRVALSYDAPYPFAVRGCVPESVCVTARRLKYFGTISSFNALNHDFYLALRCLDKKFPNVYHRLNLGLMETFDMPKDIFGYDLGKVRDSMRKLRIAAQMGNREAAFVLKGLVSALERPNTNGVFAENGVKGCFSGAGNIAVRLDGTVVSCHNSAETVGSLDDSREYIYGRSLAMYRGRANRGCATCPHTDICRGKCSFSACDADGVYRTCKRFWIPFYSFVKEELPLLAEPLSEVDAEWFAEQYRKDFGVVEAF